MLCIQPQSGPIEESLRARSPLDKTIKIADSNDLIVVCGSLFTAGEAMTYFDPVKYRPDDL